MDDKMEREMNQPDDAGRFVDEDIKGVHNRRSGASLHTRVMEELMKQKQDEMKHHSRRKRETDPSAASVPNINFSRSMTVLLSVLGIMSVLIIGLIISQFQMHSKYQKIIESLSQESIPASGSVKQQDTRIAALENKLSQVEEKVDTVIEQFDWGDVSSSNTTPAVSSTTPAVSSTTTGTSSQGGKYMKYTVQKGDTLWSLSVKFFGNGQKSNELMQINGFSSPSDLKSGQTILVPAKN